MKGKGLLVALLMIMLIVGPWGGVAYAAAPDTIIDGHPSDPTNSTSAALTFHAVGGWGPYTYQCQLDGGGFVAGNSENGINSCYYPSLSGGSHTFQVVATDADSVIDPTPASFTWLVDVTRPDTFIDSTPANPTNSTSATFTFHGTDGESGVGNFPSQCKLDGGLQGWAPRPDRHGGIVVGPAEGDRRRCLP